MNYLQHDNGNIINYQPFQQKYRPHEKKKPAVFAIPKRLIVYRITYVHLIYVKFNLQVRMFLNNLLGNKV